MIVRGEERLGAQPASVRAVLQHRPGDGHAVIGGGAAADLVQDYQALLCGVLQDGGDLAHLHHEGALAGGQVVEGADAREDPVHDADGRALCRDEGAYLGHEHDERRLAHIGALAGHVRAGYYGESVVPEVHEGVVRDEERILLRLLDDGVTPVLYVYGAGEVYLRAAVVVAGRGLGQGAERVRLRDDPADVH